MLCCAVAVAVGNRWHGVALDWWWLGCLLTDVLCLSATLLSLAQRSNYEAFLSSHSIHALFGVGAAMCWVRLVPAVSRLGGDFAVFPVATRASAPFIFRVL